MQLEFRIPNMWMQMSLTDPIEAMPVRNFNDLSSYPSWAPASQSLHHCSTVILRFPTTSAEIGRMEEQETDRTSRELGIQAPGIAMSLAAIREDAWVPISA
ncbi:hypothetical protein HRR83_003890 [Exophiala dermatitidis]|uniref:Uncharacterized protein n=1 Tax=Exophiala dermatitidis TaxID=5970 RepID=A0AAN6EXW1_EXODE|nr:hypothetical protein HRR74_002726 [Exophiala dermatitidis]KAJ4529472.1 hypothetical protein HRR73_000495 [Exophiala dermatitidis]KAJ4543871.1 hypothetical protein HRR76_001932 [Exophiala dermatitidis]KAJ4549049.1 hypothetical protein HRR77_003928 [Exophiala dermatitidis]KAJ4575337.1 hypothetical protein HRR79_002262 [Exophiala dermatitidis]